MTIPLFNTFVIPSLGSVLTTEFADEAALESYVRQPNYGVDASIPKIFAAIQFNSGSPQWDYSIRMNCTLEGSDYETPGSTVGPTFNLQRGVDFQWQQKYAAPNPTQPRTTTGTNPVSFLGLPGFLTLQLMVDRRVRKRRVCVCCVSTLEEAPLLLVADGALPLPRLYSPYPLTPTPSIPHTAQVDNQHDGSARACWVRRRCRAERRCPEHDA